MITVFVRLLTGRLSCCYYPPACGCSSALHSKHSVRPNTSTHRSALELYGLRHQSQLHPAAATVHFDKLHMK